LKSLFIEQGLVVESQALEKIYKPEPGMGGAFAGIDPNFRRQHRIASPKVNLNLR
jgi:hypothetical protein